MLIDGSVLANAPFRPAIDALRNRPARREVDRRFVYVDPTANIEVAQRHRDGAISLPGFFGTIFGALSTIPREQPIRDNLEAIERRSKRIEQTKRIIAAIRSDVNAAVESAMERTLVLYRPSAQRIGAWRARAHDAAARQAGFAYASYSHMKLAMIAQELAEMVTLLIDEQEPAGRSVIRHALDRHLGLEGAAGMTGDEIVAILRTHDLGFRIRRLRFLADRLTEIETGDGGSDAAALQAARDAIYESLAPFLDLQMRDHYSSPVVGAARGAIGAPETAVASIGSARNLGALDQTTDARIAAVLPLLSRADRRTLLLAYLGFTFYDLATLALLQEQGAQEFHAIQVDRISPDDAGSIRRGGARATLKGIEFNCFGAFFSKAYRENDYLWGRLHGAERLIDLILSTLPEGVEIAPDVVTATKCEMFRAILDEERGRLTAAPELIATIEREIDAIV